MKRLLIVLCMSALAGCGAEVATSAATGAAIKKQEADVGKQMKDMADKRIEAASQAIEQRAAQLNSENK